MKHLLTTRFLFLSIWILIAASSAAPLRAQASADELLKSMLANLDQIREFEATALIKVDVEFINIKDRKIKIRYQHPDKFTFDAEGLALLPKNGMQLEYMSLIRANYTAIDVGEEKIGNRLARIIKVIPESMESDIILAQFWIDSVNQRILRMKTFTRQSGSYLMDFEYLTPDSPLADRLVVTFEINNLIFPTKAMSELMTEGIQKADSVPKQAKVIVEYTDYKVVRK